MRNAWIAAWLVLTLLAAGCGGNVDQTNVPSGGDAAPAESGELKRRTVSSLPKVGDYLPPQDYGRIEIAPPEGWKTLARGKTFIAGFYKDKASDLPRITVAVQDANLQGIDNVTPENADEFAKRMATALALQSKAVEEPPRPIMLGEIVFARHVRLATYADSPAVIQSLQTVKNGRLYTIELFCNVEAASGREYEASLTKWRDYGYAVAANLRFPDADGSAEPVPQVEAPAEPVSKDS